MIKDYIKNFDLKLQKILENKSENISKTEINIDISDELYEIINEYSLKNMIDKNDLYLVLLSESIIFQLNSDLNNKIVTEENETVKKEYSDFDVIISDIDLNEKFKDEKNFDFSKTYLVMDFQSLEKICVVLPYTKYINKGGRKMTNKTKIYSKSNLKIFTVKEIGRINRLFEKANYVENKDYRFNFFESNVELLILNKSLFKECRSMQKLGFI